MYEVGFNMCDTIWKRLASPRETMFALKTDGSPRSICSCLVIHSAVKIEFEVLERCAIHFNRLVLYKGDEMFP
ncbi:hypothetical protein Avbf_15140 [Armadillidium vulgare]|nr:hypothetical protein Avbf_15140 [Armadillidium vulgare]